MDRSIDATVRLRGDRETLFNRLTDYPRLREWLPGVERARVLVSEGDVVVAEVTAPGLGAPSLVLELVHSPPGLAHFTRVDQYRGEGTSGTWELVEGDGEIELRVQLRPGPSFAGARGRKRLRAGMKNALEAIRRGCIEHATEPEVEAKEDGRRKILEVTRRGDTVVVWHRGKVFELPPPGGGQLMRRFGSIGAPAEVVRQVFVDFVRWPEWMPGVQEVTVLEADDAQAVIDVVHHQFGQTFHIKQRCRIEPDGLRQSQISGKFKSWESHWRFVTPPEGEGTTVSCEMHLDPGLVAWVLPKRVLRGFLDRLYEDCLSGAEAQALTLTATAEAPGGEPETLLQVFETDTGLEIWVEGQRFFVGR